MDDGEPALTVNTAVESRTQDSNKGITTRNRHTHMHYTTLLRIGLAALLTRGVAKRLTRETARKLRDIEEVAAHELEFVEEWDEEPGVVMEDHTDEAHAAYEAGLRDLPSEGTRSLRVTRRNRFVSALVLEARAEFGAPFGPEMQDPVVRRATQIKVATFLRRLCKERHVRARDIAYGVDEAVELYFVPTRRDVRTKLIAGSGVVAQRKEEMRRAGSPLVGRFMRALMWVAGNNVSLRPEVGPQVNVA